MNDTFSAFVPLSKFEENPDGTLTVFGRATQEVRDSANEVMDYQTSVPFFKERSQENSVRSAGQNLMPLRSMHQNNAAGKVVQFDYLDGEKAIDIATLVVDPTDVLKVKTGVYTGFSVGGKYARRWADGGLMRYTADPREISLVDTPAVPTAKLTLFKVDMQKGEAENLEEETPKETILQEPPLEVPYEKTPSWVENFTEAVGDLKKIQKEETENLFTNLKTLGESMGIQKRADSPLVPPKGFPNNPLEYGDPANYKYPVTKDLVVDTVERFNKGIEKYPQNERHTLGRRIVLLGNQFGDYIYLPELSKIESKENIMSDELKKLDVGTIVAGLQGQAASSAALANSDPTAAVAQLLSYIDGLTTGQPISGQNVPVKDPSKTLSKGELPPQFKAKAAPEAAPEAEVEEEAEEETSEEEEPTEAYLKLEAKVDALSASVTTLVDALTKRATPVKESPVGALNALVKKDPTLLEGLDETESQIIKVLDEGGPYALIKALEIASAGDPHGGGSMAWQKYNNAVRKASYLNLEKGGVITASRYVGRLY